MTFYICECYKCKKTFELDETKYMKNREFGLHKICDDCLQLEV